MVVHDLHLKCVGVNPSETDSPLVVDPNTVLPHAIPSQQLQPITCNRRQVSQTRRRVNLVELPFRYSGDSLELSAELAPEDLLSLPVPERPDHNLIVLPFHV